MEKMGGGVDLKDGVKNEARRNAVPDMLNNFPLAFI